MRKILLLLILFSSCKTTQFTSTETNAEKTLTAIDAPYDALGWTDEEAAAYLIDTFTFGNTTSLKNEIVVQGINQWLTQQLHPTIDKAFQKQIHKRYPATAMNMQQIAKTYPGLIVTLRTIAMNNRMSGMDGLAGQINFNEMFGTTLRHVQNVDRIWFYEMENGAILKEPIQRLELGNFTELMYQLSAQKLYRAIYSNHQLEEKLVDFWFNHFNVSITRINDVATNVLSYEYDAIRPNVLGNFQILLQDTSRHPAMLTYLDNTVSNAAKEASVLVKKDSLNSRLNRRQKSGINENYARELLELHTLGVDGGYTQKDIEEIARMLTGWKTSPLLYPLPERFENFIKNKATADGVSFIENGFYFDATNHDSGSKTVLEKTYKAGQGVNDGIELFQQLTAHPSTAHHIAKKLVTYFVSDTPEAALVDTVARAFQSSNGNIKNTMKAMVEAPEFWNKKYKKSKVKSPFEFVTSTLRASNITITDATSLLQWISKMGQPLYGFQPPTGYPTEEAFWMNEAAIAQRIKFACLLTQNKIDGISTSQHTEVTAQLLVSPQFQKR